MAKFAFIVPPLTGHINPTLSLGAGLLEKGHEVAWIGVNHDNIAERLPEGGRFWEIHYELDKVSEEKLELMKTTLQGGNVFGIESIKYMYEQAASPFNDFMLDKIIKKLDENPVDLLIVDQHFHAGTVAAILKDIPYVTSVSSPATIKTNDLLPQVYRMETEYLVSFQQKSGIPGEERRDLSKLMCLVYTSKLFFGNFEVPNQIKFIGPVIKEGRDKIDFDWERFSKLGDRTKILVSVGTTFGPTANQQFFKKIVEALGDEDYTVVVISDTDVFEHIPDNFIVQKRVPQLELLPHLDLVICHGGFNTVNETLSNAKPLIVLPKAYDQSYVASKVEESGSGLRLNFNRFKPQHLKEAVAKVLSDKEYVRNAERISQSFIEAGGVAKGVDLLESLL